MPDVNEIIDRLREQAQREFVREDEWVRLSDAVAAVRAADQHLRDALTKIEKLVAKWAAPILHDVDDRRAHERWAAVGSEAHKIASAALAASSRDTLGPGNTDANA